MNRLTAYGSDSEGSDAESVPVVKTVAPRPQPLRKIGLPSKVDVFSSKSNDFTSTLNLPKVSTLNQNEFHATTNGEDELESIVQRREWEIKLAEKEKKDFKQAKRKIDAFGGLSKTALEPVIENDVIQKPISKPIFTNNSTSKLLSMLPPPKSTFENSGKPSTSMLSLKPLSIRSDSVKSEAKRAKMDEEIEESVPSTADNDFFGLGLIQKKDLLDARKLPRREMPTPNIFVVEEEIGPTRPQPIVSKPTISTESTVNYKSISDEAARKLIYKQEVETWGASSIFANEAVMNIVDVNVDREIGSNVRETLLKNLDYKNVAAFAVGKPQKPVVKDSSEKLAKMKHQITHLATIAVAREDQLKEQWAQSKAAKVASKQKYGF